MARARAEGQHQPKLHLLSTCCVPGLRLNLFNVISSLQDSRAVTVPLTHWSGLEGEGARSRAYTEDREPASEL
jgi:hypothetical protein